MHAELRRIWQAESGGLTGNNLSYQEFLLEHILVQIMQQKHRPDVIKETLGRAAEAAEGVKREREAGLG